MPLVTNQINAASSLVSASFVSKANVGLFVQATTLSVYDDGRRVECGVVAGGGGEAESGVLGRHGRVVVRAGEAAVYVTSAGFPTGRGVDTTMPVRVLWNPEPSAVCTRRLTSFSLEPKIFLAAEY